MDIAQQVLAEDRSPERVNSDDIMSKPANSVSLEMDIRYVVRPVERCGLHREPVMEGGELQGMVSCDDIALKGCENLINGAG